MRVAAKNPKPRGFDHTALSQVPWMQVVCPRDPEPTFKLESFKPKSLWLVPKSETPELPKPEEISYKPPPGPIQHRGIWVTRESVEEYLRTQPKVTIKQVVKHYNAARSSVSRTLNALVKEGYASRGAEMVGARAISVYTRTDKPLSKPQSMTSIILGHLKTYPGATSAELAKAIGRPRLGGFIGNLKSRGLVASTGEYSKTKYYLPEDVLCVQDRID